MSCPIKIWGKAVELRLLFDKDARNILDRRRLVTLGVFVACEHRYWFSAFIQ